MNIFRVIDDFIFDNRVFGVQTLSHKWQRLTGQDCFTLSKIFGATLSWALFAYSLAIHSLVFFSGLVILGSFINALNVDTLRRKIAEKKNYE